MKKILLSSLIAAGAALSQTALASDGTVTINGKVEETTCTVDDTAGNTNKTVTLPTVSKSALTGVGTTAGKTPFTFALTNCGSAQNVRARFVGTNTQVNSNGHLINTAATQAANVFVQILDTDGTSAINPNTPDNTNYKTTALVDGAANLTYYAQYITEVGDAGAGNVATTVNYSIVYP